MKKVLIQKLDNGLTVYTMPQEGTNLSGIGVRCGSIHAPANKVGLPHYGEHLLARRSLLCSTRQFDLKLLEYCGDPDERNIRIDRTSTVYGHDMVNRRSQMVELFMIMAGILRDRIIEEEDQQIEKAAVHQETYLRGRDIIETEVQELLQALMFPNHPISMRVDSEVDHLASIERSEMIKFINRHYVASNMFTAFVGPGLKEAVKLSEKAFGDWPKVPPPNNRHFEKFKVFEPLKENLFQQIVRPGFKQTHAMVGFKTECYDSKDAVALDILSEIWQQRLSWRMRDGNRKFDEGVYRIYTYSERTFISGLLSAQFACLSRSFVDQGLCAIREEAKRLYEEPVEADFFNSTKNSLRNKFWRTWINIPLDVFELMVDATTNGDTELVALHEHYNRLKAVTRDEIQRVAQKYFSHPHGCAIITPTE